MIKSIIGKNKHNRQRWGLTLIGVILILLLFTACTSQQNYDPQNFFPLEISAEQALKEQEQGTFILDIRSQDEWEKGHIPDSTRILLDHLPTSLSEVPKGIRVVVVCGTGKLSQQGRNILLNAGFEEVTSMNGGLNRWEYLGYPIEKGP